MNTPNRVNLFVTLPGHDKELKTFIQQFLKKQNIGGVVERVKEENGYSTTVSMEANESSIQAAKFFFIIPRPTNSTGTRMALRTFNLPTLWLKNQAYVKSCC
jgi:hypothetical protein